MHWAWGDLSNIGCGGGQCWVDGKPEILDGSRQTSYISIVRYNGVAEIDPWQGDPNNDEGYEQLIDQKESAASRLDNRPVVFWDGLPWFAIKACNRR